MSGIQGTHVVGEHARNDKEKSGIKIRPGEAGRRRNYPSNKNRTIGGDIQMGEGEKKTTAEKAQAISMRVLRKVLAAGSAERNCRV